MAIQFVLEDGTGKADATTYADEAEAAQYLENLGRDATFIGGTADQQKVWLNEATAYIDQRYGTQMRGVRSSTLQALNVPRVNAFDDDGYTVLNAEVPAALKAATIEAADRRAAGTALFPDAAVGAGNVTREKVKVGPIERDITYKGGGKTTLPRFGVISRILLDAGIIEDASLVDRR